MNRGENHVGDFCRIADFVGRRSGDDFRQGFRRQPHHHRLYRLVAAAFVGRADLGRCLEGKRAWDTVVWFSALVMMASFLNKLGLIGWFSDMLGSNIKNTGMGWVGASALLMLIYMYAHYMFASTTAHITAMFGAFYAAGLFWVRRRWGSV